MKKGFTLIELLVVVLIIGILAAIALPMYKRTVARAKTRQYIVTLHAVKDAAERFMLEHGRSPVTADLNSLDISNPADSRGYVGDYILRIDRGTISLSDCCVASRGFLVAFPSASYCPKEKVCCIDGTTGDMCKNITGKTQQDGVAYGSVGYYVLEG